MGDHKMELADFVAKFEGCKLTAYQDSVGIWTIGIGSTFNPYTKVKVKKGDKIDMSTATDWLNQELNQVKSVVQDSVKVLINGNQLNALTSFAYNVGTGNLRRSTLLKMLNAGKPKEEVAKQFLLWNKAGGQVLKGLTIRRQAEADLFVS